MVFVLFLLFSLSASVSAFTIINQTDSEKVIEVTEAKRPVSNQPGILKEPVALNKPHHLTIPAKSIAQFKLRQQCPLVLFTIVTKKITGKSFKKKKTEKLRSTAVYGPDANGLLTDEWGIVIHKPFRSVLSDRSVFDYLNEQADVKRGYGIKCLEPDLLNKTTVYDLPQEITG